MSVPHQPVIDLLNEYLTKTGGVLVQIKSPMKVTMMMPDGKYRQGGINGGQEFFLKRVRAGAREAYILEFEPVDAMSYKHIEMNDTAAVKTFESVEPALVTALGFTAGKKTWGRAKGEFLRKENKKVEAEAAAEASKVYGENSMWGIF